ncbi:MAG: choice-of-anchor L domain-containing protein [Bacteroidota bacterium]
MKKYFLLSIAITVFAYTSNAQRVSSNKHTDNMNKSGVVTIDSSSVMQMIEDALFGGYVSVSNLQVTGGVNSIGFFSIDTNVIDMDCGIVMSTGNINNILQPNTQAGMGTDLNLPGDANLDALIPGFTTRDAIKIEFDFMSQDTLMNGTEFVFASEEYPEFVNSSYNDVFGFFISGPNPTGGNYTNQNIALVPNTTTPIAINNINDSLNSIYYHNNNSGQVIEFDGYTSKFTLPLTIVPDATYHFKIAISDAGDGIYDSGVFLKSLSFSVPLDTTFCSFDEQINPNNTSEVQFTTSGIKANTKYLWNFGDGTYSTEQNPVHVYNKNGDYSVNLHVVSSRSKAHAVKKVHIEGITSSVADKKDVSMNVSSTNSEGVFEIKLDNNSVISTLFVYNTSGQLMKSVVLNNTVSQIDLSNLSKGMYILNVVNSTTTLKAKIVR